MERYEMRVAMGRAADDGRKNTYTNRIPTPATLRQFRADHREITFRNKINKDVAKRSGERYGHVRTYERVLRELVQKNPYLERCPELLWNMDEISIECEFGPKEKTACSAESNASGCYISPQVGGTGVHVTAVVAVFAFGLKSPPFSIVQGKHVMLSWPNALCPSGNSALKVSELERFTRERWLPDDGVIVTSEKGSMTMEVLPIFMRHLNTFVLKHVPNRRYLLSVDGHCSRNGVNWLQEAENNGCDVVKSPAITSHCLRPYDQKANRNFKTAIRNVRERLISFGERNAKSVRFKLVCAIAAFYSLCKNDIVASLTRIGLWPLDYRFETRLKKVKDRIREEVYILGEESRRPDSETTARIREIVLDNGLSPAVQMKRVEILLYKRETTNPILRNMKRSMSSATQISQKDDLRSGEVSGKGEKNYRLSSGRSSADPAKHLTYGSARRELDMRLLTDKKREEEKAKRKAERERRKRVRQLNK